MAGSAIAIHLARRGYAVVLLDRAGFPRRKACGEGLFPAGAHELGALGIEPASIGTPLTAVRFTAGRAVAEAPISLSGAPGYGVQRERLDAALLAQAAAAGVDVRIGVPVTGLNIRDGNVAAFRTPAGPVEARAFVAADGAQSKLRRLAGLDSRRIGGRYGVTAHVRLAGPLPPAVQVFFERGYELYVTSVVEDTANVAVLTRKAGMQRFTGGLAAGMEAIIARYDALRSAVLCDAPLAAGPFPRGCRRAWRANLLLAGDAAGFYDGITGEGMSAALRGARLAADALTAWLDDGDANAFRDYDRGRAALVRNPELLARLSLTLGRDPRLAAFAVGNLARHPATFARLVSVNAGESPLRSLRPRDAAALLLGL